MKARTLAAGLLLLAAGAVLLLGWFPGAASSAGLARKGLGATLLTLGSLTIGLPAAVAFLRYTTRSEDYAGGCPVGTACACGQFTFKPRRTCSACGATVRHAT